MCSCGRSPTPPGIAGRPARSCGDGPARSRTSPPPACGRTCASNLQNPCPRRPRRNCPAQCHQKPCGELSRGKYPSRPRSDPFGNRRAPDDSYPPASVPAPTRWPGRSWRSRPSGPRKACGRSVTGARCKATIPPPASDRPGRRRWAGRCCRATHPRAVGGARPARDKSRHDPCRRSTISFERRIGCGWPVSRDAWHRPCHPPGRPVPARPCVRGRRKPFPRLSRHRNARWSRLARC